MDGSWSVIIEAADRLGVIAVLMLVIVFFHRYWKEDREGRIKALEEAARHASEASRQLSEQTAVINRMAAALERIR